MTVTKSFGRKAGNSDGRISIPVSIEWEEQAAVVDNFRQIRRDIGQELAVDTAAPSAELVRKACDCIRAPTRRVPLNPDEETRADELLRAVGNAARAKDAGAYSRHLAAALLYRTLPHTVQPRPELLQPWLAPVISAAMTDGALIGVGDDEGAALLAMRWCLDFAENMVKAHAEGHISGGAESWKSHWLPLLGFDITAINFYSGAFSLKNFVETFGRLRAEAFAVSPASSGGREVRVIGEIQPRPPGDKRRRIALFCSHPGAHGHGLPHFIWWLACMDRKRFEPILVLRQLPENASIIENFLQRYKVLQDYAPIVVTDDGTLPQIARFDFDLLYNFDDLCRGRSELPGYLRLAKKQITAFYTPATTGCTEMDHFITSRDLDPKTEGEFTEQVVLSRGLPFCFHYEGYFGIDPLMDCRDNDIPRDAVIYTMGSSMLTKLRPEFLDALLEILRRVPNSFCIAMPGTRPKDRVHMTELIIRKARAAGIAPERIRFYAVANRSLLHGLIATSDVFLDFFPFSGTNNVMDPLAIGTPCIVLCPSPGFSRNRIAGIIMHTLGLDDLVAATSAEYVDLAVRLGTDPELRQRIKARLGREFLENGPLCDGPAFVARMEGVMESILCDVPEEKSSKKARHG